MKKAIAYLKDFTTAVTQFGLLIFGLPAIFWLSQFRLNEISWKAHCFYMDYIFNFIY